MTIMSGVAGFGTRTPLKVQSGLSSVLRVLIFICILLLAGVVVKLTLLAQAQQNIRELRTSQDLTLDQLRAFSSLQEELGYDRFIHDFKNGVLRRDIDRLVKARGEIDRATSALIWLKNSGIDEAKVSVVAATVETYRRMTYLAIRLIEEGLTTEQIDRRVKVDDTPASTAMLSIRKDIDQRREFLDQAFDLQVTEVEKLAVMVYLTCTGLVIMSVILLLVYVRGRKAAARMSEALDSLDKINSTIVERVERMARFMGQEGQLPAAAEGTTPEDASRETRPEELLALLERNLSRIVHHSAEQEEKLMLQSAALQTSNEELTRFSYVASHDLQEPLRKIQSNISLIELRHKDELSEKMWERLQRLASSATRMRRLIEDLLQYSRSGTRELDKETFALILPINLAAGEFEDEIARRDGNLRIIVPDSLHIYGDRTLLVQCFTNLFSNALKYARTELPPEIMVSVSRSNGMAEITVVDNGIGFEQQFADSMFEPFKRLHGSGEYEGSGVGLSIVKKVVERHGGTVAARSSGPGTGATFILSLPLKPEKESRDA